MKNNQTMAFAAKRKMNDGIRSQAQYANGGQVSYDSDGKPHMTIEPMMRPDPSVLQSMAQADQSAISLTNNQFADGGRMDATQGGHIRGAGTGTSDSIPARLSNGEYVLPADTVRHIGKENLDQLKNATHTPANNGIRGAHFDNGGEVPGLFDATKANYQTSSDAINKAQGFGQTAGAVLKGTAGLAGGMVLDAGRDLVTNPLRAAGGVAGDMWQGMTSPGASTSAPAPTIRAQPAAPEADAPSTTTPQPDASGSIQSIRNGPVGGSTNLGNYGGDTPVYGSKQANGHLAFNATANVDHDQVMKQNYNDQMQRNADTKNQLADLEANRTQTDAQRAGGMGSAVLGSPTGAAMYQDGGAGLRGTSGMRGGGSPAVSWRDKDRVARLQESQMQNQTAMRGQDVTAQDSENSVAASRDGNIMNNQVSLQNARGLRDLEGRKFQIGQQNWTADHKLASDKFDFDQQTTGGKELADKVNSTVTIDPATGKPDAAKAAALTNAVQTHLSNQTSMLQKHLALNPNDTVAQSALEGIQKHGVGTIDDGTFSKLHRGVDLADIAAKESTGPLTPWGGRAVVSDAPITSLRKTSDGFLGFGGEYESNRGDKIPARDIEKDGSILGGIRNTKYDSLIQKGK